MPKPTSLPRICIAMGFSEPQKLLEHARHEADAGETFFEFRLDYLPEPEQGLAVIRKFLATHADCSILATCRRHQNRGKFNGSVEERSEEHTSELQSHLNLVCRLLLEKK